MSGYNLDALLPENNFHVAQALAGTEGTLVTILEATLNSSLIPKARSLLVLGYPDIHEACQHLLEILKFQPTALEGFDHLLFKYVQRRATRPRTSRCCPTARDS